MLLLLALLVAVGGLAALRVAGGGGDSEVAYDHALVRFDQSTGNENDFAPLPEGESGLSYGSPDGHRFVVQFRDLDGSGWTAPETVYEDEVNLGLVHELVEEDGTVAIRQNFLTARQVAANDDSDTGPLDAVLVCRDASCTPALPLPATAVTATQVAEDGRTALLAVEEGALVLWTPEAGVHRLASDVVSRPSRRAPEFTAYPTLYADGSVRLARSFLDVAGCEYVLYEGGREEELAEVARFSGPRPPGPNPRCRAGVRPFEVRGLVEPRS